MDDRRTSTLEALESFIRAQRLLLEQTQEDIAKLKKLKSYTLAKPNAESQDLIHQLDEIGEIKDPSYYRLVIPSEIDWEIFNGCDPAPFHALTLSTQEKHALSAKPSSFQTSPLSDLQILVKESKKTIIDPVLERCAAYAAQLSLEDEGEGDNVEDSGGGGGNQQHKGYWTVEMERERERQKIKELKKRILHAGLSLPGMGAAGVFVRNDVEDESAVVDVTVADDWDGEAEKAEAGTPAHTLVDGKNMQLDIDQDLIPNGYLPLINTDGAQTKSRLSRTRKVTVKHQQWQEETSTSSKKRKRQADFNSRSTVATTPASASAPRHAKPAQTRTSVQDPGSPMNVDEDEDASESENEAGNGPLVPITDGNSARARGAVSKNPPKAKPKSETYKQAWSESEQNLLEQLLEKIPDGEKNRWQKISRAMNGRRTPRQVASRVQKYFEKLKKYGINIAKGSGNRAG